MAKQRAIKLNLNRTFVEKEFTIEDALHIKDGNNIVGFEPACVFDEEESQSGGKMRILKRLIFLLPAFILFGFGFNIEGDFQAFLLIGGFVALVIGMIFIVVGLLRKSRRKLILFVDGCISALKFNEDTTGLQLAWRQDEAAAFVKKQMAKAMEKYRVMKWSQFFVLLGFCVVILILLLKIASSIGAL